MYSIVLMPLLWFVPILATDGAVPQIAAPPKDDSAAMHEALAEEESGQALMPDSPFEDTMLVTATAFEAPETELPYRVVALCRDELSRRQARTVPESLREVAGAWVQKTSHGQGSPYLRGFTGFRTLLLIDGVRLNSAIQRDGPNQYWNTVDLASVERFEVVSGPASVLYGSDSVGGTVQVLTSAPPAQSSPPTGAIDLRLSSAEDSSTLRFDHGGRLGDRLGYRLGTSLKSFGDVDAGGALGVQAQTGYDENDYDAKLLASIGTGSSLTAAWQRVSIDDAWRTHKTIFGQSWRGTSIGDELRRVLDQDRQLAYLRFHQADGYRLADSISTNLSWQRQTEDRERVRRDGRLDLQGFEADTVGAWLQASKGSRRGQWTWGLETYGDQVDSYRRDFTADGALRSVAIQGPVANGADYRLSGAWLQGQWSVADRLQLLVGTRYTHAAVDAPVVTDPMGGAPIAINDSWQRWTASARFVLPLGAQQRLRLFGGVSQAFRAPNLSDLTRFDSARSNEIETPSPDLDPEDFVAWELGLGWRTSRGSLVATAYHTEIRGMIVRVPTGRVISGDFEVTKLNAGDGFSQGIEVTASGQLTDRLSLSGSYSWLDGEVDTFADPAAPARAEPLDRLMPGTGQLATRWQGKRRELWLEAAVRIADRADRLSSRDMADGQRIPPGGTPGFTVLALRGGWQLTSRIAVRAAIENLTDREYRIHGSGLNEPGRNFVASAHVRF